MTFVSFSAVWTLSTLLTARYAQATPPASTASTPRAPEAFDAYVMTLAADGPLCAQQRGTHVRLRVTPRPGWQLKTTTPLNLKLSAQPPLDLPRATFSAADWSPPIDDGPAREVVAEVVYLPAPHTEEGGQKKRTGSQARLDAHIQFFLCSKTLCRRFVANTSTSVELPAP